MAKATGKHKLDELLAQQSNTRTASSPLASVTRSPVNEKVNRKADDSISDEAATRWLDVEILDDNPFQPRAFITSEELEELKADINNNGQVQAGIARPHPTKSARFQLAVAHRRKRAVQEGANAGTGRENAHQFIGQLRVEIRDLSDEQMLDYAYAENAVRQNLNAFDNARYFKELQAQMSKGEGKPLSFEQIVARRAEAKRPLALTPRTIRRIVEVLDLPQAIQDALAPLNLSGKGEKIRRPGEKHCRALLMLQPSGDNANARPTALQAKLLREIEEQKLSGDAALARASELLAPTKTTSETTSARKLSPGTTSGQNEYSNLSGNGGNFSANDTTRNTTRDIKSGLSSTRFAERQVEETRGVGDEILSDVREANSRLGRAATTLENGAAARALRHEIVRETELIEQNLARIKKSAL